MARRPPAGRLRPRVDLHRSCLRLLRRMAGELDRDGGAGEARARAVIEANPDGIVLVDAEDRVRLANTAAARLLGRNSQELVGAPFALPASDGDAPELALPCRDGGRVVAALRVARTQWGGKPARLVFLRDVTARKSMEAELREARDLGQRLAYHDALTALPNRASLYDRLQQAVGQAERQHQRVAVLLFDLDGFKKVNDTLGHEAGDLLLQQAAQRLMGCLRKSDTLARLGGDEFAVVLEGITHPHDAARVARKLLGIFAAPFVLSGHESFVTSSLGISLYPDDGSDVRALIQRAEVAMYRAKRLGRNTCQVYDVSMDAAAMERLTLENGLRKAIERHQLSVHYQPLINLEAGAIDSVEALLRWEHPELGRVPPSTFIPVAEETGLIVPIGEWVLGAALAQTNAWQAAGLPRVRVSVNLSPRQFRDRALPTTLRRIVHDNRADPHDLELEITESSAIQDVDHTRHALQTFKNMGTRVSIDDFGTGYSSLSHLKRLPIDTLKIDRSFVRGVPRDRDDAAITSAIIALGHNMDLSVVGEGVETDQQLAFLRSHACDCVQGFLFSAPVPPDAMADLLRHSPGAPPRTTTTDL